MKLSVLTTQYVAYKQDMGMRFHTEARTLRSFCRTMGDIDVVEVTVQSVLTFIAGPGPGPVTRFWHRKHEVLRGFYRFATARGYAATSPLPKIIPQAPQFVPHIFSHEELQRLLDTTDSCCQSLRSKLQPYTLRMLILLLYGAGLRISEALSLTLADVDLLARVLTIRESKFYKTRLVPIGPPLTQALETYISQRAKEYPTQRVGNVYFSTAAVETLYGFPLLDFERNSLPAGRTTQNSSGYGQYRM
jgi:site-specific recombinase XerD